MSEIILKSLYGDFNCETTACGDGGMCTGPKHAELQRIIFDQVGGVKVSMRPLTLVDNHPIVEVTLQKDNRTISEVGEACSGTLQNTVSRNYPFTMAYNRAFDRCALRFLGVYGVYADSEGVNQDLSNMMATTNNKNYESESQATITVEEIPEIPDIPDINIPEEVPTEHNVQPGDPKTTIQTQKEAVTEDDKLPRALNTVIVLRKYDNEYKTMKWLLDNGHKDDLELVVKIYGKNVDTLPPDKKKSFYATKYYLEHTA